LSAVHKRRRHRRPHDRDPLARRHCLSGAAPVDIEQALPPGTRLPEDVIGSQFGMSRTLARATLARLQLEGLVVAGRKRTAR
jgi:hypothetical protein